MGENDKAATSRLVIFNFIVKGAFQAARAAS
jgi:hypothetical protein